jgi:hypothetical protein
MTEDVVDIIRKTEASARYARMKKGANDGVVPMTLE